MEAVLTFLADHWDTIALAVGGVLAHRRHNKTKHVTTEEMFPAKPVRGRK